MRDRLRFEIRKGRQTQELADDLAALRIQVFRDYPYLYEGNTGYEKEYLKIYARSERSMVMVIYDGQQPVGATTCLPLQDETAEIAGAFKDTLFDPQKIFYFGESILLKSCRGLGIGHLFFDEREAHAASFGEYDSTCFCTVERPEDGRRPQDYRSNEAFWSKRGYVRQPAIRTEMSWPDIGEENSTLKEMYFWTRHL